MLAALAIIIPGIVAAICAWMWNRESFQLKKFVMRFFSWGLVINAIIWLVLFLMGNYEINLFEMGMRFKIKWTMLGIGLAGILTYAYKNIRKWNKEQVIGIGKRCFPVAIFLIVTYVIFMPSSLFLGNREEFLINYIDILPMLLIMSIGAYFLINLVAISTPNERILGCYIALLFSVTMGFYVQGNFLNPKFPALDGAKINWEGYAGYNVLSLCVWILLLISMQIILFLWKQKAETVMKYLAYFLSMVQLVTLIVLIVTTPSKKEEEYFGFSTESEFKLGTENNLLVFILDSLEAETLQEYIENDAIDHSWMEDFTFFNNAVSGGAPTENAFPVLLTGVEFDPTWMENDEYVEEAWKDTPLYADLEEKNYDVQFFTKEKVGVELTNFVPIKKFQIEDNIKFTGKYYQLVNFYVMPQFLKPRYWMYTEELTHWIMPPKDIYRYDDIQFYEDLKAAGKVECADYKNAFRLYHLEGAHVPFEINEHMEWVGEEHTSEQQQVEGVLKVVQVYIEALKEAELYDRSTIIILGDHGQHEQYNLEVNPAILIKRVNEKHALETNSNPVHFRNVVATLAETFLEDYSSYGPSVYNITENSDVERMHTAKEDIRARAFPDDPKAHEKNHTRYIIPEEALDLENYKIYNPYEINRISYKLGDLIDFKENNSYAAQMDYRLYKENNTAIASNELTFCLDLENYQKGDVTFNFTYADIYNDSQGVKVYAKGQKVADITCTKDGIGKENSIVIPEECIEDGVLPIRMVFPNAVTPNQLDRSNQDTRVLSVAFSSMELQQK